MMMIMLVDVSKCIDDENFLAIANNMFTKILYKVLEFQWIRFEL